VNQLTHERKEEIKVGYNLRREIVLLSIWAASPAVLLVDPRLLGAFRPAANASAFIAQVGKIWLVIGASGLVFRTVHLFFIRDVQTGLVG